MKGFSHSLDTYVCKPLPAALQGFSSKAFEMVTYCMLHQKWLQRVVFVIKLEIFRDLPAKGIANKNKGNLPAKGMFYNF